MQIQEVNNQKLAKEFIQTAIPLYKDYPNWIRPLDQDIEAIFNPKQNKYFRNGECTRWILKDNNGKFIGRVAAFINRKIASKGNDSWHGSHGRTN